MTKIETIVRQFRPELEGKTVLEAACGTMDFSLAALTFAREVTGVDLDDFRLNSNVQGQERLHFYKMDAAAMDFPDNSFDTVVIYNALCHLEKVYDRVLAECRRVLRPEGKILLVAAWKMELSFLEERYGGQVRKGKDCSFVILEKLP